MDTQRLIALFIFSVCVLQTGCLTQPKQTLPQALQFQSITPSSDSARLIGTQQPRFARFYSDRTAYISSVNGKRVMAGLAGWNQPLVMPAGSYELQLVYRMGGHQATAPITLNAQAGHAYQIQFITDIGTTYFSPSTYVDFWIEDQQTHQPVTGVVRAEPPKVPSTVYVPIVIQKS